MLVTAELEGETRDAGTHDETWIDMQRKAVDACNELDTHLQKMLEGDGAQ